MTQPTDPLGPTQLVVLNSIWTDPAVDHSDPPGAEASWPEGYVSAVERLRRYRKSGNASHLKFKPGDRPVLFECQPIPAPYAFTRLASMEDAERNFHAFLASCHEVKLPNGTSMVPPSFTTMADGTKLADPSWVGIVMRRFGGATIRDVGVEAYNRAMLPESERIPFAWKDGPAPPTS